MPYHLEKVGRKYLVITTATGKAHSKNPMTKKNAEAQMRILNAHTDVVEHLGGAIGLPATYSNAPRSEEDIANEQGAADTITGIISGTSGSLLTAAQIIAAQPGVKDFLNKIGVNTKTVEEQQAEAQAASAENYRRNREAWLKTPEGRHWTEYQGRAEAANAYAAAERKKRTATREATDEEIQNAAVFLAANAQKAENARNTYELNRRNLEQSLNTERIAKQRQAAQAQNSQYLSGLNAKSLAVQAQVKSVSDSLAKARILQQQRVKDQQLFVTKAADIKRKDFFDQERVAKEARDAMINAEQRRQAIKAAALSRVVSQPAPQSQMVPTLGRRLPPSVLWSP
jgi:hypothetical protein